MSKLPSFMFYPGDWAKDPCLRRCSHAAKGVWIDMLCLMFEGQERGYLATSGVAWSDDDIAQAVGGDKSIVLACINELTLKGVAKRDTRGAIYNSRMVVDEHKRKLCSEAGKRGGNPNLTPTLKGQSKGANKGELKGDSKPNPTPSSSSSSSSSDKDSLKPPNPPKPSASGNFDLVSILPEHFMTSKQFMDLWESWKIHAKQRSRKPLGDQAAKMQLNKLVGMGLQRAIAAIEHSIAGNYQGIFEPNSNSSPANNGTAWKYQPTSAKDHQNGF